MRKVLIAVAVATALFAVGAFAASLSVQSEDIASGSDPVAACATSVDIEFGDPDPELQTDGTWTVDGATVTFLGTTGDGCTEHDARLAIDAGSGYVQVGGLEAVSGTNTATFTFTALDVADIIGASVVVDGATLTADL